MRIDQTHKPWLIVTVAATAIGALVYVPYAMHAPMPGGGTPIGLMFLGSLALGLMIFFCGARSAFASGFRYGVSGAPRYGCARTSGSAFWLCRWCSSTPHSMREAR